jgi:hypothetical protein
VVEHIVHGEPIARCRVAESARIDRVDEIRDPRQEVAKLIGWLHVVPLVSVRWPDSPVGAGWRDTLKA